ncbi:MAG: hypothetical protein HY737_08210 [Candidatus Omnitrophica bacterium]|nr:hypothetical protein [Candidatus Omnitrophota bacterium]
MVPPKAALAIGVNPAQSTQFRETLTASGKELIPLIIIPELRIFERSFHRVTLACHELPGESPIDGLLGLDLLIPLQAVIDLRRKCLSVL